MERLCPICQIKLTYYGASDNTDYECYPPAVDHHYAERVVENKTAIIKIRLGSINDRIAIRINYNKNLTEVWRVGPPATSKKTIINHTFVPDFSDLNKLRDKIRTYVLFS
jgi:hypothetical protein